MSSAKHDIALSKQDFKILGSAASDRTGISVSSVGDVNSDRIDDVTISAPSRIDREEAAYITYGAGSTVPTSMPTMIPTPASTQMPTSAPTSSVAELIPSWAVLGGGLVLVTALLGGALTIKEYCYKKSDTLNDDSLSASLLHTDRLDVVGKSTLQIND